MAAIGILGGMGPQASTRLVELLIAKTSNFVDAPQNSDFPEIIHLSVPVPDFILDKINMEKAKQILIKRTKLLEASGCTINGIACNTAHLLLPELQKQTQVPFLSIPELVATKIRLEGFRKVGLLATPSTLRSTLYDDALDRNVEIFRPDLELSQKLENLIMKQLGATITKQDKARFKKLVAKFLEMQQLDGVILGCTELPLVLGETSDKRIIDTLQVLADGLLNHFFDAKAAGV